MNYTSEEIDLFTRETTKGASKDRPLRPVLEDAARHLFDVIDLKDWDTLKTYFTSDATLVTFLSTPGGIHVGRSKIVEWFNRNFSEQVETAIIPKLIVVNRGRIYCHIARFSLDALKNSILETSNVVILGVVQNRFSRMEYRRTDEDRQVHEGDRERVQKMIAHARVDAVFLDNTV